MINIRKNNERGHANHGWLSTKHTFSFANYFDPNHMGYRDLRVINEDQVSPGTGFPTHPHRDMEIITYVVSGGLEHKDSMGTGSIIRPGEVQHMSAGTGVTHSEFNASNEEPVHLLQIWILPDRNGHKPSYDQKDFSQQIKNQLSLVASNHGREGSISIHQNIDLFISKTESECSFVHKFKPNRYGWIQVVEGELKISPENRNESTSLTHGDGAAISNIEELHLKAKSNTEFLLFDLN